VKGLLVALLLTGAVRAQVSSGSLTGDVTDELRKPAPGVSITAVDAETHFSRTVVTDAAGTYTIDELRPGNYSVTAHKAGYRNTSVDEVRVLLNQKRRMDFALEPGRENDTITVTAQVSPLQTDDASEGYLLSERFVRSLPLSSRNVISLVTLGPGAIPRQLGGFAHDIINDLQPGRGAVALNPPVNGARSTANAYVLDGAYNTDRNTFAIAVTPPLESVSEFRIQASGAHAEFPQAGGAVIDVVTKAGTRSFHGSAFELLQNEATDARGFFEVPGLPRGIFRQNQFGGSGGGPLTGSTYFFLAYEGLRGKSASATQHLLPTADLRAGNFAGRNTIFDPLRLDAAGNRIPFADNVIPSARIDPAARKYLDTYEPLPNNPDGAGGNYVDTTPNLSNSDSGSARLDRSWSARNQMFGRYTINDERTTLAGAFPQRPTNQTLRAQQAAIADTWSGGSWVMENRLSFTRLRVFDLPLSAFGTDEAGALGLQGLPKDPFTFGLPAIIVTNFDMVQDSNTLPQLQRDNTWYLSSALSRTTGRHTWKTGVQYSRATIAYLQSQYVRGQYLYGGGFTADLSAPDNTGDPFADFLLGYPSSTKRNVGTTQAYLRQNNFGAYAQDDWRVNRRMTLTAGLRYEYASPFTEARGNLLNLDYSTLPAPPVLRRVTMAVNPNWTNFAPRAGLALKLPGLHSRDLVFRAAYGIYFSPEIAAETYDLIRNGVRNEINEPASTTPVLTFENGFPRTASTGFPSYFGIDQNARTPYVQQWSAGFQHEGPGHTLIEIAYVGTKGTRLGRFRRFNTPAHVETGENLGPRPGDLQSLRTFPELGPLFQRQHLANSIYHSLQIKAERQVGSSVRFLASFVWSKSIDDADSLIPGQFESFGAQDERNLRLERGLSFFDVRRRFSAGYVIRLPAAQFARRALAGWEISGTATLQDGTPLNPVYFVVDFANSGTPNRPNVVPGQQILAAPGERTADHFYNANAISDPAPFTFGNAGRNILPGPGNVVVDVALHRRFALRDPAAMEFRAESFNLLNHPNIGIPGPYPDFGPFFGKAFSAGDPRRLQFGLRFEF
jgi:hypothetical protein